jgi:hypothetical protein
VIAAALREAGLDPADQRIAALGFGIIAFDQLPGACFIQQAQALTTEYQALGVTFAGPAPLSGGYISNITCDGDPPHPGASLPNVLSFTYYIGGFPDGGYPYLPETITFDPPAGVVALKVGTGNFPADPPGWFTLTAYDGPTPVGFRLTAAHYPLRYLGVAAPRITHVVVDYTVPACASCRTLRVDNLIWGR